MSVPKTEKSRAQRMKLGLLCTPAKHSWRSEDESLGVGVKARMVAGFSVSGSLDSLGAEL